MGRSRRLLVRLNSVRSIHNYERYHAIYLVFILYTKRYQPPVWSTKPPILHYVQVRLCIEYSCSKILLENPLVAKFPCSVIGRDPRVNSMISFYLFPFVAITYHITRYLLPGQTRDTRLGACGLALYTSAESSYH